MIIELRISTSELTRAALRPTKLCEFVKMVDEKIDMVQCSVGARRNAFTRGIMHPIAFHGKCCNAYLQST
jgi:hypothetical protein